MIRSHCFEKDWLDSFRKQKRYSRINPPLLEKMVHALYLLQHLQTQGLSFIFKGGTSLVLLLEDTNRFSVDIDIITEADRETIEAVLDKLVEASHFKSWKLDEKRSYGEGVPKAHYELEYASNVNPRSNYVILDILREKTHYPEIQKRPIQSIWIDTEMVIEIDLPTVEGITGDKLTAFAPTTTGILYDKGKELEIIKQLFDLSHLFDRIQNIEQVNASFQVFVAKELHYRKLVISSAEVLQDTLDTCRIISLRDRNRQEPDRSRFVELQRGICSFEHYLISGHFRIDEAIAAAAKVAYLCAKLLKQDLSPLEIYQGQDIGALNIASQDWNVFNRLKRLPDPAAFFYWYQCLAALGLLNDTAR